jgi:hypothetical protein
MSANPSITAALRSLSPIVPERVSRIYRQTCERCPHPCPDFTQGRIDHTHPHAACPIPWTKKWGSYLPNPVTPGAPMPATSPTASAPIRPPNIVQKLKRLYVELRLWHKAGYPITPPIALARRYWACSHCPMWDSSGNLWLGQCRKCGCTKAKLWLATAQCPLPQPKWHALATLQTPIKPVATALHLP